MVKIHSKKTKVLCTIGPSSNSVEILTSMYNAGMDACRVNTSHGTFNDYRHMISNIRSVANIPIVMDTQGPKIRLRMSHPAEVAAGDTVRVGFDASDEYYLDANVFEQLDAGDHALLDDGAFEAVIDSKKNRQLVFRFANGGQLTSGRAVNFPRKVLPLEPLTEKDKESLAFAIEKDIDYIALSFTRGQMDISTCRYYLENSPVKIIAKIENQQGIDNFEEILAQADGIMIARGDMGVELDPEEIPIIQKQLIQRCNNVGKPVITATQMLQSMVTNPRPTRAETSDVANAILDGSDVVMLSGETANGAYPVESTRMMTRIAKQTEKFVQKSNILFTPGQGVERALCDSIKSLCESAGVHQIVTVTRSGSTAKLISRLHLQPLILAITSNEKIYRELHLHYGIVPVMIDDDDDFISAADAGTYLYQKGLIKEHDLVLITSTEYNPSDHRTNTIQIVRTGDLIKFCEKHCLI